jgi:hypothetical protein
VSHKYRIKYDFKQESGEFSAEELKKEGKGGTDCLILASMLHPEDGSYSQGYMSFDGRKGGAEMSANDEFKFWILMANSLMNKSGLAPGKKALVTDVWETFRLAMLAAGPCAEGEKDGTDH